MFFLVNTLFFYVVCVVNFSQRDVAVVIIQSAAAKGQAEACTRKQLLGPLKLRPRPGEGEGWRVSRKKIGSSLMSPPLPQQK